MSAYTDVAKHLWPEAECWGDGPYASVSLCGDELVTVMLHETDEAAHASLDLLDSTGCSGNCTNAHIFVILNPERD